MGRPRSLEFGNWNKTIAFKMQEIVCQFLEFASAANVPSGLTLQLEKKTHGRR